MKKTAALIILMIISLSGCGIGMKVAKDPAEFRAMTGKEKYYTLESFEVKENYDKVLARMVKYADECLAREVRRSIGANKGANTTSTWTPSLEKGKKKSTLILQKKIEGGVQLGQKAPAEDGYYMAIVDMKKLRGNKTHVDFRYVSVPHYREFMAMFRERIQGEGRGCPQTEMYV